MNKSNATCSKKLPSKPPHVSQDDFYWEIIDEDGDHDEFLHIVSIRDGSELKININDVLKQLDHIKFDRSYDSRPQAS